MRHLPYAMVALTALCLAPAVHAQTPEPEPGSTTRRAAGGVTLLKPPVELACPNATGRAFLLTVGARFSQRPSSGGASTVETLVLGQPSRGPRYLKPPSSGRGWDYGTIRIGACGRDLRVRYQIQLGTRAPRPKRNVTYSFTVLPPDGS